MQLSSALRLSYTVRRCRVNRQNHPTSVIWADDNVCDGSARMTAEKQNFPSPGAEETAVPYIRLALKCSMLAWMRDRRTRFILQPSGTRKQMGESYRRNVLETEKQFGLRILLTILSLGRLYNLLANPYTRQRGNSVRPSNMTTGREAASFHGFKGFGRQRFYCHIS